MLMNVLMVNHIVMVTQFARIRLAHTLVSAGLVTWEMAMIAPVSIFNGPFPH